MDYDRINFKLNFGYINNNVPIFHLEDICPKTKGSIISGPFGSNISSKFFENSGVPVIRGNNLSLNMDKFIDEGFVFVTEEKAESLNTYAKEGDLIFTAAGTIGQVGIITCSCKYKEYVISNKQQRATIDKNLVNPVYAYYWFASAKMCNYIKLLNSGSTIPLINLSILRKLPIPVPSMTIQNKIAFILSIIDKKIGLNSKLNDNLAELIQAIYKDWFINYSNFQLEQTDIGLTPKGWNIGILSDFLKITKKATKAGERRELPYVPIDAIPMNSLGLKEFKSNEEAKSSLITFDKNDILIGAMRVYFHRVSIAPCDGITRTTCFVLKCKDEIYLPFALLTCNLDSTIAYANSTSKGSTMPYAVWENGLANMQVVIPPRDIIEEFYKITMPLIVKIRDSIYENNELVNLRDTLLPKLMSGAINLDDLNLDI